jgi:hypothetical protein
VTETVAMSGSIKWLMLDQYRFVFNLDASKTMKFFGRYLK